MRKLLEKLNKIRGEIKLNKEYNNSYKAFTISGLNAALNPLLITHKIGVSTRSTLSQDALEVASIKQGEDKYKNHVTTTNHVVLGHMIITLYDLESEDQLECSVPLVGKNSEGDQSKSLGSAISYGYKYFWIAQLGLTDEELDPDSSYNNTKESATPPKTYSKPVSKPVEQSGTQAKPKYDYKSKFLSKAQENLDNPYEQ